MLVHSELIDLTLTCLPVDDAVQPFRQAADAITTKRIRLTAVLNLAIQEAAVTFADLARAVSSRYPQLGLGAANKYH